MKQTMGSDMHQPAVVVGVDGELTDRALRALLKHHKTTATATADVDAKNGKKEQLLGNDLDVQVQFTLVRVPGNCGPRPIRIDIPHPLVNVGDDTYDDCLRDVEACIIVKDSSKTWVQDMIMRFPSHLGCIKKVLTLQSLRVKHKTFEQRRLLLDRYDVFFADDRILPMLSKSLGTKFFDRKKQPMPVRLSREEALPFAIRRCLASTYMYLSAGTCLTVKAGNTGMSQSRLLANILSVCSGVPSKVPRKWSNVRSISIKTTNSVALPIYNKTPEELAQIERLARVGGKDRAKEEEEKEEADVHDDGKTKMKAKASADVTPLARALKKQRAVEVEEEEPSKKKRKGPTGGGTTTITTTTATGTTTTAKVADVPKSSKKEKSRPSTGGGGEGATADAAKGGVGTGEEAPKSSKKKREAAADAAKGGIGADEATKSSKKKHKGTIDDDRRKSIERREATMEKSSTTNEAKSEDFVAAKQFAGARRGYAFRKGDSGVGYYKDVPPAVDKVWIAGLVKSSRGGGGGGGGGGRKSMGGHAMKKKKGGNSRRSY